MTIEEFEQLKEKDKVLYQGRVCTVDFVLKLTNGFGVNLKHHYEEVRPDRFFHTFWSAHPGHCLLIEQITFISRANL